MPGSTNTGGGFALIPWRASVPAGGIDYQQTNVEAKLDLLPMPQDVGAIANGTADARAALDSLVDAKGNIILPAGAYVVSSAWTITSAQTLLLLPGATLKPASGVTVTVQGKLYHYGSYNSGAGTVSASGGGVIADLTAAAVSGAVSSVFSRAGAVTAAGGDYVASQVTNDSAVSGATVDLALNALNTGKQASDAKLAAIAGLAAVADRLAYFTGAGTAALATLTSAGRDLIDDADATAQRTTLGLGALATLASVNDAQWSGTDLAVANGGTGASTASAARTSLGVAKGAVGVSIPSPQAATYVVLRRPGFAFDVDALVAKTDAGTVTVAAKINGTDITGLAAVGATTTESATTASAARSVTATDRLEVTLSSISGVGTLELTFQTTRA